jgi:hypothetical protein
MTTSRRRFAKQVGLVTFGRQLVDDEGVSTVDRFEARDLSACLPKLPDELVRAFVRLSDGGCLLACLPELRLVFILELERVLVDQDPSFDSGFLG